MSLFISLEGPEGSGKTTLTQGLAEYYKSNNIDVLCTREPGGIRISEAIRELILDPEYIEMDARTEALLYAAARRQHLVEKVIPALEEDKVVLCDRFIDSSLAYQGYAREIGIDEVWSMNLFATDSRVPDLTIFLDVDPNIGMQRVGKRGNLDRLEQEGTAFHDRVYQGYKEVLKRFPDRIKVVDANQPQEKVLEDVIMIIKSLGY